MSAPDGLHQYSPAAFLARWMPSSDRAGVILSPPSADPLLAGPLRLIAAAGSSPMKPDDSFASDFAPLPASADSSCCIGGDGFARLSPGGGGGGGGETAEADRPVDGHPGGQMDGLDEMASRSQDVPLMMKLEQLRKWQQHMQEQLKAHQLEELLRLQEEQQRLLGMMNGSEHCAGDQSEGSGLLEAETEEDSLQEASDHRESPRQLSPAGRREWLPGRLNHEEVDNEEEDMSKSSGDHQEQKNVTSRFQEHDVTLIPSNGAALTEERGRKEDKISQERPIKPGIGGHKQTFEELLEEQLRLEDQRLKSARQQESQDGAEAVHAPPKRAFLKRGEGLSRFTNNRKTSLAKKEAKKDSRHQPRVITRSNSEPTAIQRGGTNCTQRLPVQRKTAKLNKENRLRGLGSPPQDNRAENKTARTVLGSYQRQNTEGSESQTKLSQVKEQNNRTVGLSAQTLRKPGPHNTQPNPVTKQVGLLGGGPGTAEVYASKDKSSGGEVGGGHGVPVDSFELSFQDKLQHWECDRQLENMELGEFELLEQAAEELSFSSNSSFVVKVLQMDKQHRQLHAPQGLYQRRLSSTPIKSPPGGELQRCRSVGSDIGLARDSGSVKSEAFVAKVRDDAFEDKMRTEDKEGSDNSDASSCSGSEFEHQEGAVEPPLFPSTLCFPTSPNPPYDKWSYQDEDSRRNPDGAQGFDGESDSFLGNADESTLIEDTDGQQRRVVFDDDDTWNDTEETPNSSRAFSPAAEPAANGVSAPVQTLLRKVAVSKVVELDKGTVIRPANLEPAPLPPPASQLMTRLFPSLKPKAQNLPSPHPLPPPPPPPAAAAPQSRKLEEETGQQVQSRQLRERLVELEIEIDRFKKENAALTKLRQENEKNQENLRKERLEFEQTKAEELAEFEEYKKEENRKLQRERKVFEKHVSAARAIPDKKEREEIQALKQQLSSLQEELRRKESRWASAHGRLRQQIDSLGHENGSLRDEICMLEKLRLSTWKKTSVSAEKDKETKDGSRIFANNVSSVTKGVKFASPLDSRGSSSSSGSSISPLPSSAAAAAGRRSSMETSQASTGMKSSLRRPSVPIASSSSTSSSSSLAGRRTELERSTAAAAGKSQDKLPEQSRSCCSPVRGVDPDELSASLKSDSLPKEPACSEPEEVESSQEVVTHPDGKTEKVLSGGDRLIVYPNGTRKEVSADGLTVKVTFFNGDTKQITADQRVIYYYSEAQTSHVTYPDGMEVLHFPNKQTEKHFPDGRKEITFPDQTVKNLFPDGREESVLTDGTVIHVNTDGTKEIHFNTGQKEIHTADFKRREYPDGTVKTVYADGRQETRYPTGRLRIKDKDGNIVLDNNRP
ncbi:centromere protein J isoform X2 [Scophthalmus maximus]|uniref:centromere protein J isoform X2 n=1 Tax=Scophthalmus maximus TaxID=52904 RepID=UPI001FA8B685|nr:centromere protein J isoform X2 [Scophthalmus maximus]